MSTPEKTPTKSRNFDTEVTLGPDATIGDKLKALRLSRKMTLAALSRASGLSDRAIRYIENNERQPGVEVIKKLSAALGVGTDYFLEDSLFREEAWKDGMLAQVRGKYGSRGMAQARQVYEMARSLYAGGGLSEEEQVAFRDLMMELFFDSKEVAKKYTPKKYRK